MSIRVGQVCYATTQGLGYLAKAFYDAGVVKQTMIFRHPHGDRPTHTEWYPPYTPVMAYRPFRGHEVNEFLKKVDVVIFYETPFDWEFLKVCRRHGVKTAVVTMYEWWPENPMYVPDLYLCPSLLDKDYFTNGEFVPIPASREVKWQERTVARRFLHNSGHIGSRNHKGTEEVLKAVPFIKSPIELTIRSQEVSLFKKMLRNFPEVSNDPRVKIELGDFDFQTLFDGYDVLVQPEKYNGLSLPLQEAYASGMTVMTTNRYPANTWLPKEPLIDPERYEKARVARGYLEFDEAVVAPRKIAETIDEWYDRDISSFSQRGKQWAEENSWEKLAPVYLSLLEKLCQK